MRCPRCRSENQPEAHFCEECGARLELACPACGQPVTAGKKFCRSCGAALATAGEVARSPSPQSYTPKYLAEKILTSKGALEGERKQVTVLFAGSLKRTTRCGPNWTDAAIVLPHAVRKTRLGPEALAELHRRLRRMPGASWRKVFCLCVLAELYAEVSPEEGLRVLASIGETDRQAFLAPEVFRLEGELRLRSGERAADAAEHCFHTAIELARRRGEKSLELRATASLARLWGQQDRRADAHRALADVYAWFTEGFDTTDLSAAKGLLADLAG